MDKLGELAARTEALAKSYDAEADRLTAVTNFQGVPWKDVYELRGAAAASRAILGSIRAMMQVQDPPPSDPTESEPPK